MGKYTQWREKKEGASLENQALGDRKKAKRESEVFKLFNTATEEQRELINRLTNGDYEKLLPRASPQST